MNAIIEHVWTPDELAPQGSHGIDNVTAEELELLQQKNEAVLRRANGSRGHRLSFDGGRLAIDRDAREVTLGGTVLDLTRSEFDLLHALATHAGRVFSRFELINRVQGYDYDGYERTIDQHVKNLRRKLGEDPKHPRYILTAIGVGYKFGMKADA